MQCTLIVVFKIFHMRLDSRHFNIIFIAKPLQGRIKNLSQLVNSDDSQLRRSRMETMFDILKTIASGTEKPTHIMYRANLSWRVMQQYLKQLESQGVIAPSDDQGRRVFHLTEKGFRLLEQFNTLREGLLLQNNH